MQKRGQYAANNELLEQLNKQFDLTKFPDDNMQKTKDSLQRDPNAYPFAGESNIAFTQLKQNLHKDEQPVIKP